MKIINKIYKIDKNLNKKIVLISDMHYSNKKDLIRLNVILDNIKKLSPDFICIPGDIIDKSEIKNSIPLINWFKKLSKISKVIISIGNHEFYIDKKKNKFGLNKDFIRKLSSIENIYLLDNESIVIDKINFLGLTEKINKDASFKEFLTSFEKLKTNDKYYNILLCHSPIYICSEDTLKDKNIDLVLCGHMHGGVVLNILRPIFKTRGIISPNKKLFPKNAYGKIKIGNTNIIISSGLRVLPYKLMNKIFKPEIVEIYL